MRKDLAVRDGGEQDMREGAGGLRGAALCGRGEYLCRGRPVLGSRIAADGVDGGEGRRRGCSGRRSPRDPRSSSGARSVVSPTSLFSKLGRPPAARRGCGPDLGDQISNLRPAARADQLRILLSICTEDKLLRYTQGGKTNLADEALTKRSKCDDSLEQKLLLRCTTEMSDGGVSQLMLAITWARRERTCAPARGLEYSGRMLRHSAPASSCRGLLAARRQPERGSTWPKGAFDVVSVLDDSQVIFGSQAIWFCSAAAAGT